MQVTNGNDTFISIPQTERKKTRKKMFQTDQINSLFPYTSAMIINFRKLNKILSLTHLFRTRALLSGLYWMIERGRNMRENRKKFHCSGLCTFEGNLIRQIFHEKEFSFSVVFEYLSPTPAKRLKRRDSGCVIYGRDANTTTSTNIHLCERRKDTEKIFSA